MALLDNKIGTEEFVSIIGTWIPPAEQVEVDQRPGVDGTQVTKVGKKGRPFTVLTRVDTNDYPAAHDALQRYQGLIDGEPITMIQGGVSSDTLGFKVQILDVQPRRIQAIKNPSGAGAKSSDGTGWIEAVWQLIGIAN
jgi:hypothetical protein